MSRHAAPRTTPLHATLLRAALAVSAAGAALAAGAGTAGAAQPPGGGALAGAATGLADGLGPVKHLRLDPMAGTTVDPLTNAVGTQVADFRPVGTQALTKPLTDGGSLSDLPLVGSLTGLLPG